MEVFMDKIQLLQSRKQTLANAGKRIREDIAKIIDPESLVEFSTFSFSKNDFYGENAEGEGVITGFATVNDYPFYVIAQNFAVLSGGLSKANCAKIVKCLNAAEKNQTPVLYLLNTLGVQVGEGVEVLEGISSLLLKVSQLKGVVPQYVVVNGEVYGSAAMLAAIADFTFFQKESVLALNSPLVLSASEGKNLSKKEIGSAKALDQTNIPSFEVNALEEVKELIGTITDLLAVERVDAELNEVLPVLNEKADPKTLFTMFESYVEVGAGYASSVHTLLGRIGGIAVAAILFDDSSKIDAFNMRKIKDFAEFASCHSLPFVTFVDCVGLCPCRKNNNSLVLKEAGEYLAMLDSMDTPKIALVTGKAIGLGYSLFAAKSLGFDYTYAFANAKIALFDSVQGAEIEFGGGADREKLAKKYADEVSDPINAAKGGYIDNIIEPQFAKQYLIASLQMLMA